MCITARATPRADVAVLQGVDAIAPGDRGLAQIVLDDPLVPAFGDRLVLRDQSARRTIGRRARRWLPGGLNAWPRAARTSWNGWRPWTGTTPWRRSTRCWRVRTRRGGSGPSYLRSRNQRQPSCQRSPGRRRWMPLPWGAAESLRLVRRTSLGHAQAGGPGRAGKRPCRDTWRPAGAQPGGTAPVSDGQARMTSCWARRWPAWRGMGRWCGAGRLPTCPTMRWRWRARTRNSGGRRKPR